MFCILRLQSIDQRLCPCLRAGAASTFFSSIVYALERLPGRWNVNNGVSERKTGSFSRPRSSSPPSITSSKSSRHRLRPSSTFIHRFGTALAKRNTREEGKIITVHRQESSEGLESPPRKSAESIDNVWEGLQAILQHRTYTIDQRSAILEV